jgi:hypothetical protein
VCGVHGAALRSVRVRAVRTVRSQMVQVVSMLEVPIMVGSVSFQSNDVKGAQYSEPLF